MNIKLIKEISAPLLSRNRLNFEIDYSGNKTPSKEEIRKMIAPLQKVKEELVIIRHIYPRFGKSKAKVITHIYKTLQDLKKYESEKVEKKVKGAEKSKEEKPKEEKVNAKEESKEQKAE